MNLRSRDVALAGIMAALANVLGFLAIPGPWNIKFSLTAIPILLVAFARGATLGALTGLFGGIVQALNYGWIGYVIYTAIQGAVAGYLAKNKRALKVSAPIFMFFGGFFMAWWIDLLRGSGASFDQLVNQAGSIVTGAGVSLASIPLAAITLGIIFALVSYLLLRKKDPFYALFLAGAAGAVAYVPYDAFALYVVQHYPWIPTWFVLAKDLVQDFIAAALTALIVLSPRIKRLLK